MVDVNSNKTYIQDKNGKKYYFDINIDTTKNSSSDVADSPIDSSYGASLSDKRVINMRTVGISGKYSSKYGENPSFGVSDNRLGIIIAYFEEALAKQEIYTVYRKGEVCENMMLNKISLKFGEFCNTVEISLSFIEVLIIGEQEINISVMDSDRRWWYNWGREYLFDGSVMITAPEGFEDVTQLSGYTIDVLSTTQAGTVGSYQYKAIRQLNPPKVNYTVTKKGSYWTFFIGLENSNPEEIYSVYWNNSKLEKRVVKLKCYLEFTLPYHYGSGGYVNSEASKKSWSFEMSSNSIVVFRYSTSIKFSGQEGYDNEVYELGTIKAYFQEMTVNQVVVENNVPLSTTGKDYETLKVKYLKSESDEISVNVYKL